MSPAKTMVWTFSITRNLKYGVSRIFFNGVKKVGTENKVGTFV